ncbi:ABC transporter permease [Variovorax sp. J22P271]|uniref:ABC transporter permease n=1 Tax=Variovorax davisae TaxID=3053515 RepID=UPI002575AE87|nr:ABC transporter permease [Variovorax sp. J22P271]MDM0031992.1 ABC transporter permease [Variovorax sp. J22P271]
MINPVLPSPRLLEARYFSLRSIAGGRWFWPATIHLAVLAAWWAVTTFGGAPKYILPSPQSTLMTLTQASYNWPSHVVATTIEVFGGYLLAVVVGIALALVTSWSRWLSLTLMPLLVTLNMIPKIALAPLFIVWLSYGVIPNIIITFTICFFPIVLTTARGLKEVEPDLIDLVRTVKASRWQIFSKIQLPSALPYIFSGMKVASVFAVAGAVVGEFIGSEKGLGNLMLSAQATMDTDAMFMAVILITLIGVLLYGLVFLLEHLLVVRDARLD